jgi:hypothetical protein
VTRLSPRPPQDASRLHGDTLTSRGPGELAHRALVAAITALSSAST